ncbi:MAG: DUF3365 domain-containing protein [Nitrospirae bacterium]|nr:DUF3365 domain-containing protein [Nitrospirota bacterium]
MNVDIPHNVPVQVRNLIAGLIILLVLVTSISLFLNLHNAGEQYRELAAVSGRSFFDSFVAARIWNAKHGGLYAPLSDKLQPNPYLEDPMRDVKTEMGVQMTKVNPAYMTRLIAEELKLIKGFGVKITSLKYIRPENKPDDWEKLALERLDKGEKETFEMIGSGEGAMFRYIGALTVEESCLKCHSKMGYKVGDVRGGISISFPYSPFHKALAVHNTQVFVIHLLFFTVVVGVTLFLGKKIAKHVVELQDALDHIKRLEGILPICSYCKKIRIKEDYEKDTSWTPIENYLLDHTDAMCSHSICPACFKKHYSQ